MKYPDGTEARIGDHVEFSNGEKGTIVFSIDTNEYSNEFPKTQWSYLKKGVMIRTDKGALIHYEDPNVGEVMFVKE
jgi:hypothetical protein